MKMLANADIIVGATLDNQCGNAQVHESHRSGKACWSATDDKDRMSAPLHGLMTRA